MKRPAVPPYLVALGAALATACAGGVFMLAEVVARPSDLEAAKSRLEQAAALAARAKTASPVLGQRADAICPDPASGVRELDARLRGEARPLSLTLSNLRVSEAEISPATDLSRLRFELSTSGSLTAVTAFLANLAAGGPEIFVERSELRREGEGVSLELAGEVLCHDGR